MNLQTAPYHFQKMKRKYQRLRGAEILLWSVGIGVLSFYLCRVIAINSALAAGIALALVSIAVFVGSRKVHLFGISEIDLAMYLNRYYPVLQESADLLLKKDEELSRLQLLQKERTANRFEAIYPTIKLPHKIGRAIGMFGLSVLLSVVLTAFSNQSSSFEKGASPSKKFDAVTSENLPTKIKSGIITIFPPGYTQIGSQTSEDFNLKMPEGSNVVWDIIFEEAILNPLMIFSGKDSARIEHGGQGFRVEKTFSSSGFYQLVWDNPDGSKQYSNYYEIEVTRDRAPVLMVEDLKQFTEFSKNDHLKINLKTKLTDDYGLTFAKIVATVSKGSGEAIKFREEKLTFDAPAQISGKSVQATKVLDLAGLGLQPGDELYFYIEAADNKIPSANHTRTDTYFIELQDTLSMTHSLEAGLGVDLMPEYFRSQRQIIIDSEKLLREKQSITKQTFNTRSNDLAHDQKVLRLRYGEFLGEEFQSSVGPQNSITDEQAGDIEKTFGHAHDTENDHNQVGEKKSKKNHSHGHEEPAADKKASALDNFVHAHDGDAEATFFAQSIRTKLKAAVTIMWDAELFLRLYQPEKSLPYQYQALKLLKEVSQDSRIYVHRTGFDPPPLKEEKRLTGNLKEIKNSMLEEDVEAANPYTNIREALTAIEILQQKDPIVLSQRIKDILTKAGHELGEIELENPGRYLKTLSLLNNLIHGEASSKEKKISLLKIRESFWKVLPQETMTPLSRSATPHELDLRFLKNLELSNP